MKKRILFLLLLLIPFLLTGCGDKEEESSKKEDKGVKVIECSTTMSSIGVRTKVEFDEKKQEVVSATADYIVDYSGYSDAVKEAYKKQDLCASYLSQTNNFTSCEVEFKENEAIIHTGMNTATLNSSKSDKKITAEEFKAQIESKLGSCTIK